MDMAMVGNAAAMRQSETMMQLGLLFQKKVMDLAELQGQMVQEMMASMGVGGNLDIRA